MKTQNHDRIRRRFLLERERCLDELAELPDPKGAIQSLIHHIDAEMSQPLRFRHNETQCLH